MILLVDDLVWHPIESSLPVPNTECYIKVPRCYYPGGEKAPVYDIVRVKVCQSNRTYDYGKTFFYRDESWCKRNVFLPDEVNAWAEIPGFKHEITQILPCPFCGGKAELHHEDAYEDDFGDMPEHWWVGCQNKRCKMTVQTGLFLAKDNAIKAWNTRKVLL